MDLKDQRFGIEIELTGVSREQAAKVAAEYFGTRAIYIGTFYDTKTYASSTPVSHVGLYVGNNQMLHCGDVRPDRTEVEVDERRAA